MIGQRFGKLVVVAPAERPLHSRQTGKFWLCDCDCGGETVAYGSHLRHGHRTACGCVRTGGKPSHRMSKTPEYAIWACAKSRCNNPRDQAYADYGGRGVQMCPEWQASFEAFLREIGPRPSPDHTLDREDNDGPYSPDNCRWATSIEQGNNRRNNRHLEVAGERLTVAQAARATGIPHQTILGRLRAGRSDAEAISPTPLYGKEAAHG